MRDSQQEIKATVTVNTSDMAAKAHEDKAHETKELEKLSKKRASGKRCVYKNCKFSPLILITITSHFFLICLVFQTFPTIRFVAH